MSDYGVQRCQITEVVFYTKVLVHDIMVGLERILDYTGVGLEGFDCTTKARSNDQPHNSTKGILNTEDNRLYCD